MRGEIENLEEEAKIIEKKLKSIKIEGKDATYYLLKSDGLDLHHAGYFIPGNPMKFAQLFYAFTSITKMKNGNEVEERKILPFIIEVEYKDSEITNAVIKPLSEVDYIDLGETVAKIEKKTIGFSGLSTQLPLEVVEMVYRKELPEDPIKELRLLYKKVKEKLKKHVWHPDETIFDILLGWSFWCDPDFRVNWCFWFRQNSIWYCAVFPSKKRFIYNRSNRCKPNSNNR